MAYLRARGHALHLATNQEHFRARYLWDTLGFSGYFDTMQYSAEIGCAKPDRLFFSRVALKLPQSGYRTPLLVDDQPANVSAAREMGWEALLWDANHGLDQLRNALA